MQVPENAETRDLTIQGLTFQVPQFVTEKHFNKSFGAEVCTPAMGAQIMQQTIAENLRNNFAKTVTAAVLDAAKAQGSEATTVKEVLADDALAEKVNETVDIVALQTAFDNYILEYEPGVRRTGGGGASLSPVDRESRRIAVEIIKDYLERELSVGRTARSETYKAWDAQIQAEEGVTGAEYIDAKADELMEANPSIRTQAEETVARRKQNVAEIQMPFAA